MATSEDGSEQVRKNGANFKAPYHPPKVTPLGSISAFQDSGDHGLLSDPPMRDIVEQWNRRSEPVKNVIHEQVKKSVLIDASSP